MPMATAREWPAPRARARVGIRRAVLRARGRLAARGGAAGAEVEPAGVAADPDARADAEGAVGAEPDGGELLPAALALDVKAGEAPARGDAGDRGLDPAGARAAGRGAGRAPR